MQVASLPDHPGSSGAARAGNTWPVVLASMTDSNASRYPSWYSSGAKSPDIASMSVSAIRLSASLTATSRSSTSNWALRTSSGHTMVCSASRLPRGRSTASDSLLRTAILARPTRWVRSSAARSSS